MRMNLYELTPVQRERVGFLARLARELLDILEVPFTGGYLDDAMTRAYANAVSRPAAPEAGERSIVDWNDPSNLAVVLLDALREYHVKYELSVEHHAGAGVATLAILHAAAGDRYDARLVVAGEPIDQGAVEHYVVLKRSAHSQEPDYAANLATVRARRVAAAFVALLALGILAAMWESGARASLWVPSFLMLGAGVAVSQALLLLTRAPGSGGRLLESICGGGHRALDCRSVLASSASRISILPLAEVGAVFFTSLLAFTVLGVLSGDYASVLPVMLWCTALAAPYSLYLIVYQFAVVRSVCLLCMAAQALILAQLGYLLVRGGINLLALDVGAVATLLAIAAPVAALYALVLRWVTLRRESAKLALERYQARTDLGQFDAAAAREPRLSEPQLPGTIVLGDPRSPLKLGAILSLSCSPCGLRLTELRKVVDWFDGNIAVTVLVKPEPHVRELVRDLLRSAIANDTARAVELLKGWYDMLETSFARRERPQIPLGAVDADALERDSIDAALELHSEWFAAREIPHTPMLFHNGRSIPPAHWDTAALITILEQRQEELEARWSEISQVA